MKCSVWPEEAKNDFMESRERNVYSRVIGTAAAAADAFGSLFLGVVRYYLLRKRKIELNSNW